MLSRKSSVVLRLLKPSRSEGNTRLYTQEDIERLEVILKLTRDFGVNLAGVEIILNMREKMAAMQRQFQEFVETLNEQLATMPQSARTEANSLIRVINLAPLAAKGAGRERRK